MNWLFNIYSQLSPKNLPKQRKFEMNHLPRIKQISNTFTEQ